MRLHSENFLRPPDHLLFILYNFHLVTRFARDKQLIDNLILNNFLHTYVYVYT